MYGCKHVHTIHSYIQLANNVRTYIVGIINVIAICTHAVNVHI